MNNMQNELDGLRVSIIHDEIIEDLGFLGDQVVATLGSKTGPVCGPILDYEVTSENSILIDKEQFNIAWEEINVEEDKISVLRNGIPTIYKIVSKPEVEKKKRNLP